MDLSVLLALDSSAFEAGLKAASEALARFKAGADVCIEAVGRQQESSEGAAASLEEEAAAAAKAAEAERGKAEAGKEAAKTLLELAAAQQESNDAGKAAQDTGEALRGVAAAAKLIPGPAGQAVQQVAGIAGAARQAQQGMVALGVATKAAMTATVVLAVAAAIAIVVQRLIEAKAAAEDLAHQDALDGLRSGAERAADAYRRLSSETERLYSLVQGLDDASAAARRIDEARQLAELERERAEAIAANPEGREDADAAFDARRRQLEAGFRRQQDAESLASLENQKDANERQLAAARERLAALESRRAEELAKAREQAENSSGTVWNGRADRYSGYSRDFDEAAAATAREIRDLLGGISDMQARAAVLEARIEAESGRSSLRDAEEAAAEAKALADAAVATASEAAAETAREDAGGPAREEREGSVALAAADRLARIGGSLGGDYAAQNRARMQYEETRRSREILERIEEKVGSGDGAVWQ